MAILFLWPRRTRIMLTAAHIHIYICYICIRICMYKIISMYIYLKPPKFKICCTIWILTQFSWKADSFTQNRSNWTNRPKVQFLGCWICWIPTLAWMHELAWMPQAIPTWSSLKLQLSTNVRWKHDFIDRVPPFSWLTTTLIRVWWWCSSCSATYLHQSKS
jgi:hypothetical protein